MKRKPAIIQNSFIRNPKKRGEWVELKFMVKAAEYGLGVTKPWGDSSRHLLGGASAVIPRSLRWRVESGVKQQVPPLRRIIRFADDPAPVGMTGFWMGTKVGRLWHTG